MLVFGAYLSTHAVHACKVDGTPDAVEIGTDTPVCLVVGKQKITFLLEADKYTALDVPGCKSHRILALGGNGWLLHND